ncbi:MAG: HEAT repeat domain-containing protein [Kangiellaceae bacterium]|nr:HEAT repeat domain-containing protein [Kangiellaceae bacterium]MCW9000500.1 HEAT repeat domain-containing protein [Kangiellaceae bacterium]
MNNLNEAKIAVLSCLLISACSCQEIPPAKKDDPYVVGEQESTTKLDDSGQQTVQQKVTQSLSYRPEYQDDLIKLRKVQELPFEQASELYRNSLNHSNEAVRLATLESLSSIDHEGVVTLLELVLEDDSMLVRKKALTILAEAEKESATPILESFLFQSDPQLQIIAINGLATLGKKSAIASIGNLLVSDQYDVKKAVVLALGEIGGELSIYFLQQAISDRDSRIRRIAAQLLEEQ